MLGLAVAGFTACQPESPTAPVLSVVETGNGAPSGAHYNLNLIGVTDKKATMDGSNGHVIFVPLWGNAKIYLTIGDFQVLDANGTDNDGASFQLPAPDPDGDGITAYSVYIRALGKPLGKATLQSCYTLNGEEWCAVDFPGGVEPILLERTKGQQLFVNVSKDLLFVDVCVQWDPVTGACLDVDQIPLFSDATLGYLWSYDNQGLKLAQLRFYEIPTTTPWAN
ncbi:MAG TPA: hypothetical protein VGQ73_02485 [Gemmatimonadales bacterium]|jgi:hypothetical protein|nr:hypothetical protein [Gemmatimonadales bacterium]